MSKIRIENKGYIDIQDINGTVVCWATWMDIDESGCFELVKED